MYNLIRPTEQLDDVDKVVKVLPVSSSVTLGWCWDVFHKTAVGINCVSVQQAYINLTFEAITTANICEYLTH